MDSCDVVIVGGGPAGSTCAWKLKDSGLDVMMLDKAKFPRDKACGGWITPAVFEKLEVVPEEYGGGRTLQPMFGFRIGQIGGKSVEVHYDRLVGYGIRRCELDQFLVERSGVWLQDGEALTSLERADGGWVINKGLRTSLVVGAGGHFCPVARFLGAETASEMIIAAQEIEFLMDETQQPECSVIGVIPEVYFCRDMKGYGWCFRKGNYLNIGLGRKDRQELASHVNEFVEFLISARRIPADTPIDFQGHAYLLYGSGQREVVDDGVMLLGDAAGLAYRHSGEGIRPAVESGFFAADTILRARGNYSRQNLESYRKFLATRLGSANGHWAGGIARLIPAGLRDALAHRLLPSHWFAQNVIVDRWFLHSKGHP